MEANLPILTTGPESGSSPADIDAELLRRAHFHLEQRHLVVDYYRIRRRIAYPLPVRDVPRMSHQVGNIKDYPWSTWLIWTLEDRIQALGWAHHLCGLERARAAVEADLLATAHWRSFHDTQSLDLLLAHSARTLATAYREWSWLDESVREGIAAALHRIVSEHSPFISAQWGRHSGPESILRDPQPKSFIHNIPVLGALGVSLAAHALGDERAIQEIDGHIHLIARTLLHARDLGHSEGLGYDGHVLDFLVDWFECLSPAASQPYLDHPQFERLLGETYLASAPGDVLQIAPLSDVEPKEMRLHAVAQLKALHFRPTPARDWYCRQLQPHSIPTVGLPVYRAHLTQPEPGPSFSSPVTGVLDAHYLRVQRTGWTCEDLAVATAVSNSPFGHIHCNNGTFVIGTAGQWLLTAPGYQQYLRTSERDFTLGLTSHNTPIINGKAPEEKAVRIILEDHFGIGSRLELDLTACYPAALNVTSVIRRITLVSDHSVEVEDQVSGPNIESLEYYWHGHPEAAWCIEEDAAVIHLNGRSLRLSSPQASMKSSDLYRLKGSRGQLTLHVTLAPLSKVQWMFGLEGTSKHPQPSQ